MSKLVKTAAYERNPFGAQMPPEVDTREPIIGFLQEVVSTLREQHNATQTGDSSVPWEDLTEVDTTKDFSLGSLGRFLHPDYGIITARYVEFVGAGITDDRYDYGLIAGYTLEETDHEWCATTKFSESSRLQAVGLVAGYTRPVAGNFGWVITSGVNLASIYVVGEVAPAIGDTLVWAGDHTTEVSQTGTALGVVASIAGMKQINTATWELAPAAIRVDVFQQPGVLVTELTDEQIQNIAIRVGLILDLDDLRRLVQLLFNAVDRIDNTISDIVEVNNQQNTDISILYARKVQVITDPNIERVASSLDHLKFIRFLNNGDVIYRFTEDNDIELHSVITIRDTSCNSLTIVADSIGVVINPPFNGTLISAGPGATIQIVKVGTNEYDVFGHVGVV